MPELLPLSLARRGPGRIRPRLDLVRTVLDAVGRPHECFPSLLIAGTNGKGSTAAMVAAVVEAHGVRTGLYTSPHLVRVEERIRIAGRDIDRDELDRHLAALDAWPELSFFEALTVAALLAFATARVDCAVLEVGMGGRWDATRAAEPVVAGLTNIGSDHREWLGDSPVAIAAEKGAALAAARVAVLGAGVRPDLLPALGVPAPRSAAAMVRLEEAGAAAVRANWGGGDHLLPVPLAGAHQLDNLQLALALTVAAAEVGVLETVVAEAVRRGLAAVRWPGRLARERIAGREVLLDCAHNLEGALALAAHLARLDDRPSLLFSCLADKPVLAMAAVLRPVVADVAVFPLPDERAMSLEELTAAFPEARVRNDALTALALLPDPVVAAGSLRVVGTLLEYAEAVEGYR